MCIRDRSAAEEEFEADNVDGDVQPMTPDETIAALRNPEVREILAAANQTMACLLYTSRCV